MIKKYTTALLFFMGIFSLLAQEQPGNRKKANEYFIGYEYGKAVLLYQKLVDKKNPHLEDMERLAYSSYQVNDYELATNWYARVVEDPKSSPDNLLMYAHSLKQTMQYHEAKEVFERYIALTGKKDEVALDLAGCDEAIKWLASPSPYDIKNEVNINTPLSEFGAFPTEDTVYYAGETSSTSKRYSWTGNSFLRIFSTAKEADNLGAPSLSTLFNEGNKYHIGPISGNKTGDTFFVTQTYVGKKGGLGKVGKKKYRTNRLELNIYTKGPDGKWSSMPFAHNNVKEYSVGHATLSTDEQLLYFISDMPGSIGGTDIWYCEKNGDGSWGTPQNAGKEINSKKNELFPNLAPDGTLYYSSNGFAGMGGLDVYKSKGTRSEWTSPENLRYPANSSGDDFSFVISKVDEGRIKGYFSSNRTAGMGSDDIYSFTYPGQKMTLVLEGATFEGKENEKGLEEVAVSLKGADQKLLAKKLSGHSGRFTFNIEPDREYILLGQKTKHYSDSLIFNTRELAKMDTIRVALHLEPLFKVGKKFILEDIHYDFDKDDIRMDAASILNELVRIMRDNPTLKIELSSHTDSRGSDGYNLTLSNKRAASTVNYIVSRGISRERMEGKGYGETQLLNNCSNGIPCSQQEHQQNRRTEVRVLSF